MGLADFWPEASFWASWQSWVTVAVAVGAVVTGFITGRWGRVFGIAILTFATLYAIALTNKIQTKAERYYAYFIVPPVGYQYVVDGKIQLWSDASGILRNIKACALRAVDYKKNYPFECWYFDAPAGRRAPRTKKLVTLGMDNWMIDIDGEGVQQTVLQWLDLGMNNGTVIAIRSKVIRKSDGKLLCETPPHQNIKPCQ